MKIKAKHNRRCPDLHIGDMSLTNRPKEKRDKGHVSKWTNAT